MLQCDVAVKVGIVSESGEMSLNRNMSVTVYMSMIAYDQYFEDVSAVIGACPICSMSHATC